jgi:hypothetical protein
MILYCFVHGFGGLLFFSSVVQIGQTMYKMYLNMVNVYVYNTNIDIKISARDAMQLH